MCYILSMKRTYGQHNGQGQAEAERSILTMNQRAVYIERLKLINSGHLNDSSYHLDILIGKLNPIKPVKVYTNVYILKEGA